MRIVLVSFACQTVSIKAKGEWILSTKTPAFQSFLQNQDTKFGACETAGVPQSVMLWQTFQGNSEDFGQDACSMAIQQQPSQLAIMDEDPVVKWAAIGKTSWRPRKRNNHC